MPVSRRHGLPVSALSLFLCAILVACSQNSHASNPDDPSTAKQGFLKGLFSSTKPVTVPEGTDLAIVLDETLSSAQNRSGDKFQASLASPVVVDDETVIPQNSRVIGHVVEARPSGRLRGVARLDLTLDTLEIDGKSYDIVTADKGRVGKNHNKRNGILIGGGAALGALIGGVATGGVGAAIGAGAGAGAGPAGAAYTGKKDIRVPAETTLTFQLVRPVTISIKKT
jgi:hypothetical protein